MIPLEAPWRDRPVRTRLDAKAAGVPCLIQNFAET
jgi:hypothetical protein